MPVLSPIDSGRTPVRRHAVCLPLPSLLASARCCAASRASLYSAGSKSRYENTPPPPRPGVATARLSPSLNQSTQAL
jgi:hypothetical protein